MAQPRRSPQHRAPSSSISSPSTTRRNTPVLVPLQPNLRRLPSRVNLTGKDVSNQLMRDPGHVITGSKRKRVVSSNENAHMHGRPTRGSGSKKRARTDAESQSDGSEMDVDGNSVQEMDSDTSEEEGEEEEVEHEENDDSCTLSRLLKVDLVRLYESAGLPDEGELFTKSEIIDALVNNRDDHASPSEVGSSEESSDDGNFAEATNGNQLRRRVTLHEIAKTPTRPMKSRSLSMGNILGLGETSKSTMLKRKASTTVEMDQAPGVSTRRRTSARSSPATSATTSTAPLSPPTIHLRSRNVSLSIPTVSSSSNSSRNKGKGKAKQVEFNDTVEVREQSPPQKSTFKDKEQPSPRRLRSKDRAVEKPKGKEKEDATPIAHVKQRRKPSSAEDQVQGTEVFEGATGRKLRVTPMRKAKGRIGNLKESDSEDKEEDELLEEEREEEQQEEEVTDNTEEEEEVDELVSSASITPPPEPRGRRTPVRNRLRPRRTRKKVTPTIDEENEGDDEEEEEEVAEGTEGDEEEDEEDEGDEEDDEGEEAAEEEEDDEATIAVEPRKLRNGKIVGEEEVEMDVDEESVRDEEEAEEGEGEDEEEEGEGEEADAAEEAEDNESIDVDAEGETDEDETMEDDVDLTVATAKTLVRLRRDDLVRLCETREIDPRQANEFSSPSSAGTVRPSSGRRKRRTKAYSTTSSHGTPVLLRSTHTHTDEPPVDSKTKEDAISEFRGQLSAMDIKELKLLGAFNHPNIVRFLGVSIPENTKETPVMIVSELCSNGDLFDYIRNVHAPTLHKVGTAKIADFGLAKVKQSTRSMVRSLVGTVNWQAPELWHAHPKYNHKVDVFSCAMVYWEMLQWHAPTKKFPWEGMNEHAIYEVVGAKRQRPSIAGLRKQWCPEIVDLIERMWAQEHQDRPTMSQVVEALEDLVAKY
ncbi:hypothetical protein BJ912DRAFT_953883 [Pholiota molesta]|nr:hypothetical protein BJ912DRAFT_953883 [Pholiota molesta]